MTYSGRPICNPADVSRTGPDLNTERRLNEEDIQDTMGRWVFTSFVRTEGGKTVGVGVGQ